MLSVEIKINPPHRPSRVLHRINIINQSKDDAQICDYLVEHHSDLSKEPRRTRVTDFPRDLGPVRLVQVALGTLEHDTKDAIRSMLFGNADKLVQIKSAKNEIIDAVATEMIPQPEPLAKPPLTTCVDPVGSVRVRR